MKDYAEVGNAIIITREFLNLFVSEITKIASEKAIEQYKILKSKDEKMTVSEVAKQERCTPPTVVKWINTGIKKGKIKLKASRKGERNYIISRYDLNEFLESKK